MRPSLLWVVYAAYVGDYLHTANRHCVTFQKSEVLLHRDGSLKSVRSL
jgi:hypothetical protein